MAQRSAWRRSDRAVGDLVGTLLLVALAVAVGAVVSVLVAGQLAREAPPHASFALAAPAPGAEALVVQHRSGAEIPLDRLQVTLLRDGVGADVPRAAWGAGNATLLRPGDRLALPLDPPAAPGERLRVLLVETDANALLADLEGATTGPGAALGQATVAAAFSPAEASGGARQVLLEASVRHPMGALAVARVEADLAAVALAAGVSPWTLALNDAGAAGDLAAGDGTWSGLVVLPATLPAGAYAVPVRAFDLSSHVAGEAAPALQADAARHLLSQGAQASVPSAADARTLRLSGFSFDTMRPARATGDALLLRVSGAGGTWSAALTFQESQGQVLATSLRVWTATAETEYGPVGTTRIPLSTLTLDLLDPTAGGQWERKAGAAHPTALYPASGVGGAPVLHVPLLGQDAGLRSGASWSAETGVYAATLEAGR